MEKDIKKEPKKKIVVVEEVAETPEVIEAPKAEESQETEQVTAPAEVIEEEVEKTNYLWIIVPTALLIGALVGGLITYFSGISKLDTDATPSPVTSIQPVVEAVPSASPSITIKRDDIKLQVLNGSGVSGLAGKAKTYLEGLGYKNVVVGNASMSNLTETTISVKESKKDLLEQITTDLSKNYKVSKETETLVASSKYDFIITLGSK